MPRPATPAASVSINKRPTSDPSTPTSPQGHQLIFYADHAIWDETSSKFVSPQDVSGYTKL